MYGFWPANSLGDDIVLYTDETRQHELTRFHTLRQQWERKGSNEFFALADFIAPVESGRADYLGAFAVTAGLGIEPALEQFQKDHDDYHSIMLEGAGRSAGRGLRRAACTRRPATTGVTGKSENLATDDLIDEKYRGIRPAPGYPACPDHTEKRILFDLLDAEKNTGIRLTESFAMYPAAAVSGLYFAHPQVALFLGRPDHQRPGRSLRRPQGNDGRRSRTLAVAESGV